MDIKEKLLKVMSECDEECIGCLKAGTNTCSSCYAEKLINRGVFVPTFKTGDNVWVIEIEDGRPADISCVMVMAQTEKIVIASTFVNNLDVDETIDYHIEETRNNLDTDLMVYPIEFCFSSKEEAEDAYFKMENEVFEEI